MCEQKFELKLEPPEIPSKKILWLVWKEHKDLLWENTSRLADLCSTCDRECFEFSRDGISSWIWMWQDILLDPKHITEGKEKLQTTTEPIFTKVKIAFFDPSKDFKTVAIPELYPEMDIIVVDQGDFCKIIKNRFGELKTFRWENGNEREK